MDTILYTSARQSLAKTMARVCANHEAIIITSLALPLPQIKALPSFSK
jgi:PHD/YefM family antitoxin component YafN of YafNO toxin-antitoxin module